MPDTDLTPRTSHTGLYAAGAAALGLGWLASLRLIDEPGESMAERRMRARWNPDTVRGMKAHVTKIELNRAEGPSYDTGRKTATSFDMAQTFINTWAHTAPKTGGYDKVDFTLHFSDGEKYGGRLDIKYPSVADDNELAEHVKNHLMIYSGQWRPPYMDDERYARFMANLDPKDQKECAEFLRTHRIGDKAQRNKTGRKNPRKPGKYPGFVIQTIEVPKGSRNGKIVTNAVDRRKARAIAEHLGARKGGKIDEKTNFYRFRQVDPKLMTKKYISLKLPSGIIVKALPKATAKKAKIKNTSKPLTAAERKRLLAL